MPQALLSLFKLRRDFSVSDPLKSHSKYRFSSTEHTHTFSYCHKNFLAIETLLGRKRKKFSFKGKFYRNVEMKMEERLLAFDGRTQKNIDFPSSVCWKKGSKKVY